MRKVISSVLCVTGSVVIYKLACELINSFVSNNIQQGFLAELVFVILAVVSLVILKKTSVLKFKLNGFKEGASVGASLLVVIGIMLLGYISKQVAITESGLNVVMFLIHMLLIGVTEEVLFRGILQNAFHEYFGTKTYGAVVKAIVLSSAVFGLTHFTNVFRGVPVSSVAVQALLAIPAGMIFGVIYYRSNKNLWVGILIHALNDAAGLYCTGILSGGSVASTISSYSGSKAGVAVLYLIVVLVVMRKSKMMKINN